MLVGSTLSTDFCVLRTFGLSLCESFRPETGDGRRRTNRRLDKVHEIVSFDLRLRRGQKSLRILCVPREYIVHDGREAVA